MREYLERDVMPATEGRVAFTRASPSTCSEWWSASSSSVPRSTLRSTRGLVELLGRDGTIRELTVLLADDIRRGAMDSRWSETVDHVRATVRAKLEVANPGYLQT